jgi:hypothetical protein
MAYYAFDLLHLDGFDLRQLRWSNGSKRAGATKDPELKAKFTEIAAGYRDMALQIDDPKRWQAKVFATATTKQK